MCFICYSVKDVSLKSYFESVAGFIDRDWENRNIAAINLGQPGSNRCGLYFGFYDMDKKTVVRPCFRFIKI